MALGLLAACAGDEDGPAPPFRVDLPVERLRLDNGLEVVLIPNHTSPVVTALVAIRAGSAVEQTATNGYSHLFEHMIFQGSEAVPDPREFSARLDSLGADRNGTTSVDRVTYFFTVERAALEPALTLFADAITTPALDPVLLEKEKQVVLGEFDINESDADFLRYRSSLEELYGEYATQLNPLGQRATVSLATPEQLRAMHAAYYVPENALLVLSGDLSRAEAEAISSSSFGAWQSAQSPPPEAPPPAPASGNGYRVMQAAVSFSSLEVWWQGPSLELDPEAALVGELLSSITLQTDHHFRTLVSDTTFMARFSVDVMRHTSTVRAQLIVAPGSEATALDQLRRAMANLGKEHDVSEQQLETAKRGAFRSYLFTSTAPASLPHAVADAWALEDSRRYFDYVDDLYRVDRAALQRFADSYVRGQPHTVVLMSSADNLRSRNIDEAWLEQVAP